MRGAAERKESGINRHRTGHAEPSLNGLSVTPLSRESPELALRGDRVEETEGGPQCEGEGKEGRGPLETGAAPSRVPPGPARGGASPVGPAGPRGPLEAPRDAAIARLPRCYGERGLGNEAVGPARAPAPGRGAARDARATGESGLGAAGPGRLLVPPWRVKTA